MSGEQFARDDYYSSLSLLFCGGCQRKSRGNHFHFCLVLVLLPLSPPVTHWQSPVHFHFLAGISTFSSNWILFFLFTLCFENERTRNPSRYISAGRFGFRGEVAAGMPFPLLFCRRGNSPLNILHRVSCCLFIHHLSLFYGLKFSCFS